MKVIVHPNKEIAEKYRRVFGSREGLEVLNHMMFELGVFSPQTGFPVSEGLEWLRRYGVNLLHIVGGNRIDPIHLISFLKKIMGQPLPESKNE